MKFAVLFLMFVFGINVYGANTYGGVQNPVYPVSKKSETQLLNGSWDFKYIAGSEIPEEDKDIYLQEYRI